MSRWESKRRTGDFRPDLPNAVTNSSPPENKVFASERPRQAAPAPARVTHPGTNQAPRQERANVFIGSLV